MFRPQTSVRTVAVGVLGALLTTGCSTVKTSALDDEALKRPTTGLVYYLPIRTFDIDAKFVISNCVVEGAVGARKARLIYDVQPTVRSQILTDRRRSFRIDEGLNGRALKALNFDVALYDNGALKSVNMVADDRTAETATNIVSGALKMSLGFTGLGMFSGGGDRDADVRSLNSLTGVKAADDPIIKEIRENCGSKITDALLKIRELTSQMDPAAQSAEAKGKLAGKVTAAEKAITDARANLKTAKETEGVTDLAAANQRLNKAISDLASAQAALEAFPAASAPTELQQRIAAIVQRDLTFTVSKAFVPAETPFTASVTLQYGAAGLNGLGVNTSEPLQAEVVLDIGFAPTDGDDSGPDPTIAPPADQTDNSKVDARRPASPASGIWIRIPATATMKICAGMCGADDRNVRLSQVYSIPQWGQITALPLKSMAFTKSTVKVSFAPDGAMTSFYFDSAAPAERASAAFVTMGQSLIDYGDARRKLVADLAAAEDAAEKARIEQQIAVLDLNQKLADAQSGTASERQRRLDDLEFQLQQTEKEIKLLEASRRLEALRAATGPAAQ